MESMLTSLKLMLGFSDSDKDDLLQYIINATANRLILLLGLQGTNSVVPSELEYIVVDVACARFNRIASEGARSNSVEGESLTFYDYDFEPYMAEIDAWLATQDDDVTGGKGKVRFI